VCAHQSLPVARRVALLGATHLAGILVKSLLGGWVGFPLFAVYNICMHMYIYIDSCVDIWRYINIYGQLYICLGISVYLYII